MTKYRTRALATALAAATAGALLAALPPTATAASPGPDRRVIVELSGAPAAAGQRLDAADSSEIGAKRRSLATVQQGFLTRAGKAGVRSESVRRFTLLGNAVAMTVPQADLARLGALPGVVSVSPDLPVHAQTDVSVPLIGAPQVWERRAPDGTKARGAGVTVAILDSGVDYDHPDLGGGFGPGHKVVAGYDFVNHDDDPMDDNGHGTHVAGIIAGRAAKPGGITGVAPDASLTAYKVMDDYGSGYTSDIIAGLEAATDPANPYRADVVNMSLTGEGDGHDPLGLAATAAVRSGVVVVAAAGNAGPGPDSVGTPAAADGVIAVGASTSGVRLPTASLAGAKPQLLQTYRGFVSANPPAKPVTAKVVDIGDGSADAWAKAGDVRGKIVLARTLVPSDETMLEGQFLELAKEAERRGATALLGGDSAGAGPQSVPAEPGVARVAPSGPRVADSGDTLRMDDLVVLGMDDVQYPELTARVAAGPVEVTIRGTDITDQIASFSSRGPSPTFGLKPDLVAPGVEIRSTIPTALWAPGQYRMSGTSMAAPHVAGSAALLRQLRPGWTPAQVTSALVNSAKPLAGSGVTTQGAGRLDVAAAARTTLTATPSTVSFGLADLSGRTVEGSRTVTLTNTGDRRLTARLGADGDARLSVRRISLPPGGTARVGVRVSAKRPVADTEIDGRITVTPDRGPALTVPYLLVARPLVVQASPDPSDGHTTAYVYSPAALSAPPVLTVTPPRGKAVRVTTVLDHGTWYRAELTGAAAGAYRVTAAASAATGQYLTGDGAFEVTPESVRDSKWQPVGPNSESGSLSVAPSAPREAVLTQPYKAAPWLTTDNGQSWSQLGRLPVAGGSGDIVIDAHNADRWWYAVNGDPATGRNAILRTVDRGRTWRTVMVPGAPVTAFTADAATRVLVAATATDLLISRDGGDTWAASPASVDSDITAVTFGGENLYLRTFDSVYVVPGVIDGAPGPAVPIRSHELVSGLAADEDAIAVYLIGTGVVVSHDQGKTWTTAVELPYGGYGLTASGGDLFIGAGSDDKSYVSHDHGRTWTVNPLPTGRALLTDYDRWADGSVTVSSELDGVYRSAPDGSGSRRIGVQGQTADDLAVSGDTLLAGTPSGVYRTRLPVAGPEWGASGGEGTVGNAVPLLAVDPRHPAVVWKVRTSAFGSFDVDRSADHGATWTTMSSYSEVPTALLVDPADSDRVYVSFKRLSGPGLYTTTDGGKTWRVLHHDTAFTSLAGDPRDPRRLWLGAADGLYRSDDGGVTVTKVAEGLVSAIERDGSRLIVGGDGVRVSSDGGKSFRTADVGGLPTRVSDVLRAGGALYAATTPYRANGLLKSGRGVLRSTDNGRTWTNVSSGLQDTDATKLAAGPDGHTLYVGTVDGGVHRMRIPN